MWEGFAFPLPLPLPTPLPPAAEPMQDVLCLSKAFWESKVSGVLWLKKLMHVRGTNLATASFHSDSEEFIFCSPILSFTVLIYNVWIFLKIEGTWAVISKWNERIPWEYPKIIDRTLTKYVIKSSSFGSDMILSNLNGMPNKCWPNKARVVAWQDFWLSCFDTCPSSERSGYENWHI